VATVAPVYAPAQEAGRSGLRAAMPEKSPLMWKNPDDIVTGDMQAHVQRSSRWSIGQQLIGVREEGADA